MSWTSPFGTLRSSSAAAITAIRAALVSQALGTRDYYRVRFGIGRPRAG